MPGTYVPMAGSLVISNGTGFVKPRKAERVNALQPPSGTTRTVLSLDANKESPEVKLTSTLHTTPNSHSGCALSGPCITKVPTGTV